jgi:AraC-like DNA-binding protein
MFQIVILYISATLGFICLASIYGKPKLQNESFINKFRIVIIGYQGFRFTAYATLLAAPNLNIIWLCNIIDVTAIALVPCLYLYFENIVFENKFQAVKQIHFIAPTFFIFIFSISNFVYPEKVLLVKKISFFVSILFCYIYSYLGFQLLKKNVWERKSEIKVIQNQNKLIKKWTFFLLISFFLLINILLILMIVTKSFNYNYQYIWVSGLIWNIIFIKILLTPEILYGYNFLNKNIDAATAKVVLNSVWKISSALQPITNEKDVKMAEIVAATLAEIIHKIEELSFHSTIFRNPELGFKNIATEIKIPVSHISHIFRFHCNESFTDYKKIVRIHDATKLLEKGFLYDKTVESLAETVGFSSYVTFYNAFKSITGVTTQEYVKRL